MSIQNEKNNILHSFSNKKFWLYFEEVMISLGIIGMLVPAIVDISINRKLTWSLINAICILYFYTGFTVFFVSKSKKWMKGLATYSILLIPFLYGLESLIDYFYLNPSQDRFMEYALPISALWLVLLWSDILVGTITKINHFYMLSILFLLAIIGTSVTNSICYKISWIETFHKLNQMIEVIEYIGCAIFFFFIGTFQKINRKRLA